mgnify:CR=1 FL=1
MSFYDSSSVTLTRLYHPSDWTIFHYLLIDLFERPKAIAIYTLQDQWANVVIETFMKFIQKESPDKLAFVVKQKDKYVRFKVGQAYSTLAVLPIPRSFIAPEVDSLESHQTPAYSCIKVVQPLEDYQRAKKNETELNKARKRIAELEAAVEEAYRPDGVGAKRAKIHFEQTQAEL